MTYVNSNHLFGRHLAGAYPMYYVELNENESFWYSTDAQCHKWREKLKLHEAQRMTADLNGKTEGGFCPSGLALWSDRQAHPEFMP